MSYTWCSILKGIKLVKKGMIWHIGNGKSVHIWNDPWIPRGITRQPTYHRGQNLSRWVNELIDPTTGRWDVAMVQQTFHPDDVQTILDIPVGEEFDDYIAWHFDKKGVFTVKSAYKVQIDKASSRQGTSQGGWVQNPVMGNSFPWNKIWSMKCPNKVKVFAWRLAHNSLPLKRKIQSRGMDIDTLCPVCWRVDEDAGHMLLKCKNSMAVWRELQLEIERLDMVALQSAKEVFFYIWGKNEELQMKVITTLWVINMERNAVNAGEKQKSVVQLSSHISRHCLEFGEFFARSNLGQSNPALRWKKPRPAYLKINVDASCLEVSRSGGWGFVIKNEDGEALAAGAGHIVSVATPLQAEALACWKALLFAADRGMMMVEMESDCV
jgi:hypothetical protein